MLVEDAVTYRVFFDGVSDVNCDVVGQKGPKVVRCALETVRTECAAFIAATVAAAGHIWQLEPCSLEIVDQFDGMGPHLAGRTAFGDNVEVHAPFVWAVGVHGSHDCSCRMNGSLCIS